MGRMAEIAHPLGRSVFRGLRHRCPGCGEGQLFGRYLKVEPNCGRCGHNLVQYRADDGPAYLTIVLVGHLLVAPLLFFPIIWQTNPLYSLPILLAGLVALTLALLSRVKGGWIGLMYSLDVSDRDDVLHTADLAD
jgi:uncharacterized protein (DUF983 family)